MGRWLFRLTVKNFGHFTTEGQHHSNVITRKISLRLIFFTTTVKICKFLRLTVKFLAVLQLSVNPNKTFQKKRSSRTGLNITGS